MRILYVFVRNMIDDVKDKDDEARVRKENLDQVIQCSNIWNPKYERENSR